MSQAFQPIFLDVAKRGQKQFFLILILLFLGSRGPLFEPFMSVCPPHLAPSFFEKVQIGSSGGPEFWAIWKVRDPQDLIFKTPNRGPESPLPSQKSERPSGPHF